MSETAGTGGGFVDRLKGKVKQLGGAVVDDEQLRREGELHEEKADAVEQARRLDAGAAQERAEAEIVARERELAVESQELTVEQDRKSVV